VLSNGAAVLMSILDLGQKNFEKLLLKHGKSISGNSKRNK
jgi:hypothetical protein